MPLTCLIAAHDPWLIQLIRMFVEESGFRAVQVYESQDVIPMARQEHPVAVVLQADLPGTSKGSDVLFDLQRDPDMSEVPVLLMASHGSLRDGLHAPGTLQGAAAYLPDPITYETFQDALARAGVRRPGSLHPKHVTIEKPTPKPSDD